MVAAIVCAAALAGFMAGQRAGRISSGREGKELRPVASPMAGRCFAATLRFCRSMAVVQSPIVPLLPSIKGLPRPRGRDWKAQSVARPDVVPLVTLALQSTTGVAMIRWNTDSRCPCARTMGFGDSPERG